MIDVGQGITPSIQVRSSSELVVPTQPFPTTIGGPGKYKVIVSCKRSVENILAALFIDIPEAPENASSQIRNARPVLLMSVSPTRTQVSLFILLVLVGVFLTGTSSDFFKEYPLTSLAPHTTALLAKVFGGFALAMAAWIAFRKLPSSS
jgi:hypothetical protein